MGVVKNVLLLDGHFVDHVVRVPGEFNTVALSIYHYDYNILRKSIVHYTIIPIEKSLANGARKRCFIGFASGASIEVLTRNYQDKIRNWLYSMPLEWKKPSLLQDGAEACADYIIWKLDVYSPQLAYNIQQNLGGDWQNKTVAHSFNGPLDLHTSLRPAGPERLPSFTPIPVSRRQMAYRSGNSRDIEVSL